MKDRKSNSKVAHTHNFIDYKIIPKNEYQKSYKYITEPKPEDNNGIYRHLKNQKIINSVFARIFGNNKSKKMTKSDMQSSNLFKARSKSQMNSSSIKQLSSSKSEKRQKQESLVMVQSFNQSLRNFHKSMCVNKKRVSILNRLNKKVIQFEDKLPIDLSQQTRQSVEQNDKLIKICIEDSVSKQQKQGFNQRYEEIVIFNEPRVDATVKKQFMKKKYNNKIRDELKRRDVRIKTMS